MAEQNFLEKDLEQILFETDQSRFTKRGLSVFKYEKIFRQVNFGGYGIADLITVLSIPKEEALYRSGENVNRGFIITIYELKQKQINISSLLQASRYFKAIIEVLEFFDISKSHIEYRVCLIGSTIDTSNEFIYLTDLFPNLSVFTYSYKFDGIYFERRSNHSLIDPSIPNSIYDTVKKVGLELLGKITIDDLPF